MTPHQTPPSVTDEMVEALQKFIDHYPMGVNPSLDEAYRKARAALAAMPGGVDVKPLDWQTTYVDRGDGQKEESGWEADNGFNQWYSVEMYFGTDSYGWRVMFDGDVIADHDDPERAKAAAQEHFASRILSRLKTSGAIGAEGWRLVPEVDYSPALEAKAMMVLEMGEELIKAALSSLPTPPTAQEGK